MKNKYLTLLAASAFAFFMQACGDDSSSAPIDDDVIESSSSSSVADKDDAKSSSSVADKDDAKSSSSVADKDDEKSSSSIADKDDAKSSSSVADKDDEKSSSSEAVVEPAASKVGFVFGSDYKAGELRWFENGKISEKSLSFHQDSKVVYAGKNLFVLERTGADNISLIDTDTKKASWQVSLDDYSNPSDIVLASETEAWVSLADAEKLIKISLKDGKEVKSVKTGDFTTEGGTSPNLVDLEVSGDTLFAIFQRYVYDAETWSTTFPKGLLAMYKLSDGELLDTVQLATKNPMAVKVVDGNVYVATQGEYNAAYGTDADENRGIEKVDLSKKTSKVYVSGKKLGGGVSGMLADYKSGVVYATVYKAFGDVPVAIVDVAEGSAENIKGIADAEGGLAFDAAEGVLYVGDRSAGAEAVYTYDGKKATKVESVKDALPPYSVAF